MNPFHNDKMFDCIEFKKYSTSGQTERDASDAVKLSSA